MMFPMATPTALVTGAARGIGLACARRLRLAGCRVIGADLGTPTLQGAADEFDVAAPLDVTDSTAMARLVTEHGPFDIVVNSAGIVGPNKPTWQVSDDEWRATIRVNLDGVFNVCRATVPGMIERGWGRIVNIASIAGKEGNPNLAAYSASKAAVIGFTKSLAKEVAVKGVLVNSIAPAVISTPMNSDTAPEVLEYMIGKIPMARTGSAEEVAALVLWLSSSECSFSTGACYDISGGRATY